MTLTLTDVRRIASDVAQQENPALDVVGVTPRQGSTTSAEVIFADECSPMVIGISRHISEIECRAVVRTRLRERLSTRTVR
jgi:hypothetical protein